MTLFVVFFSQMIFAQNREVTGVVTDKGGLSIPGVNVLVKGSKIGVQTDFDGNFTIKATPNQILVFSYQGYKTQEILAKSEKVSVKLLESADELKEVVVTAMGIKRNPRDLGYSVSKVKASDLTENSEPDLLRSLSGKVAGVNVNMSSGVAGASNQVLIRGISSFTGAVQPLIIVDGVAFSNTEVETGNRVTGGGGYESGISNLDPNNIASVSILKSTVAAALYGSRAANGVIVITTKTGSSSSNSAKKMSVNFSTGTYFETIANLPEYQNTYGAGANFVYSNANGSWGPKFGSIADGVNGLTPNPSDPNLPGVIPTWPTVSAVAPWLGATVPYEAKPNNVKDLFRTGVVYDNSVGFNYSGADGSFSATISDLNQDGYMPYNNYNRTSISAGGTFKLANKLTVGSNLSFSDTKQIGGFFGENQFNGASSSFARTLYLARNWDLSLPYTDPVTGGSVTPNGSQFDHPLWAWEHDQIITGTNRIVTGLNLNYEINKNISASYRIGYNKYILDRDEIRDLASRAAGGLGELTHEAYTEQDIESTLLFDFNYALSENFGLKTVLGNNVLQNKNSDSVIDGSEFKVPGIFNFTNIKNLSSSYNEKTQKRTVGAFVDATLSYKEYLFLNATGRNDWTSSFSKANRSYFYPSVSGSLILTEALKLDSKVLTFAKLRAGYAQVGRDADAEFRTLRFLLGQDYGTLSTIRNDNLIPDLDVEPEFITEKEIGTDLEFFNQRIVLDLTYYNKISTNLVTNIALPASTGATTLKSNLGDMSNKGIEIGLTLVPIKTNSFKWTFTTNFTKNKNEVTSLKDGLERVQIRANTVSYIIPGQPYGVFFGSKFARDADGNYLINPSGGGIIEASEPGIIGDPTPDFKLSNTNTFSYKGFSLKTQFDWKKGGDISSTTIQSYLGRGVTKDTEDREHSWIIPGYYGNADGTPMLDSNGNQIPNTIQLSTNELYFSPGSGAGGNTFAINSVDEADIYDGTVFRLREASLTYDLPSRFLEKTPFGRLSFSVMGSNLWYFAPNVPKYTNFDPETTSYGSSRVQGVEVTAAPTAKRYGFKLNLTF